jgi:hypothetical protein
LWIWENLTEMVSKLVKPPKTVSTDGEDR